MENLVSKVSYLKGLAEGLNVDKNSNDGKLLLSIIDVLSDIASEVDDLSDFCDELDEKVDEIDSDLADIEEIAYGDEDDEDEDDDFDDDMDFFDIFQIFDGLAPIKHRRQLQQQTIGLLQQQRQQLQHIGRTVLNIIGTSPMFVPASWIHINQVNVWHGG